MNHSSVKIAKERVKSLVTSDRVHCSVDCYEKIQNELYQVLSKYIEFTEEDFKVDIERTKLIIYLSGELD